MTTSSPQPPHAPAASYDVVVGAGVLGSEDAGVRLPHRWTDGGVSVQAEFTGAHLLHLAAAGCVLNDVYREGAALGLEVTGVRVRARGGFDTDSWTSTGIEYVVEVAGPGPDELDRLLARVDEVAEIPRVLRAGAEVRRVDR